jgi:replicative DNA helicase
MEQELFTIAESNIRKNYESMSDILMKAVEELEKKQLQKSGLTGIPSGFTDLDRPHFWLAAPRINHHRRSSGYG